MALWYKYLGEPVSAMLSPRTILEFHNTGDTLLHEEIIGIQNLQARATYNSAHFLGPHTDLCHLCWLPTQFLYKLCEVVLPHCHVLSSPSRKWRGWDALRPGRDAFHTKNGYMCSWARVGQCHLVGAQPLLWFVWYTSYFSILDVSRSRTWKLGS